MHEMTKKIIGKQFLCEEKSVLLRVFFQGETFVS
jgi:hypothetical protein